MAARTHRPRHLSPTSNDLPGLCEECSADEDDVPRNTWTTCDACIAETDETMAEIARALTDEQADVLARVQHGSYVEEGPILLLLHTAKLVAYGLDIDDEDEPQTTKRGDRVLALRPDARERVPAPTPLWHRGAQRERK